MSQLLTEAELNAIAAQFGTFTYPDAAVSRLLELGREYYALRAKLGRILEENGCDCECDHGYKEHEASCRRCLACAVQGLLGEDKPNPDR